MRYEVGQIIYLLDVQKNAVLPSRVFEQVIKKTIDGEEESFYVGVPGHRELLNLSDFEGHVFEKSTEVKEHLFETLKNNIEKLVDKAVETATEEWGEFSEPATIPKPRRGRKKKNEKKAETKEETLVDLGDGRVARLKE